MRGPRVAAYIVSVVAVLPAFAPAAIAANATGGATYDKAAKTEKAASKSLRATWNGPKAVLGKNGLAIAPAGAPAEVQEAIASANKIVGKPYRYGGGHAKVEDTGYDCSGTISYALIGAGLLKAPLDSGSFMRWGKAGPGEWITVYTNPGHAYVVIAGLRLDTSAAGDPGGAKGPRWRPTLRSTRGYTVRHPAGF